MLPYGERGDWLISFVDLETTGLKPGFHEVVDAGIVISDLEGEELDRFHRRVLPIYPDRTEDSATRCNGFSLARWKQFGALSKEETVRDIEEFYRETTGRKNVIFCAYNESFDLPFLDHLFRSADREVRELHDYTLDLPSIAWGKGFQHLHSSRIVEELGIMEEPMADDPDSEPWEHTGLTGALKNLRIYRALLEHEF